MSAYARSALLRRTINPSSRTSMRNREKRSNRIEQDENEGTETQLNTHDPYQFSQVSFMEQNSTISKSVSSEEKKVQDVRNPYKSTKLVQDHRTFNTMSKSSYQESSTNNASCVIQMSQNSTQSQSQLSTLTEENSISQSQSRFKKSFIGTETTKKLKKTSTTHIKQEKQSQVVVPSKRPWMSTCMDIINPYRRKRIKQYNSSTEDSEINEKKYIEYNDSKVSSNNGMNNTLVVRNNIASAPPATVTNTSSNGMNNTLVVRNNITSAPSTAVTNTSSRNDYNENHLDCNENHLENESNSYETMSKNNQTRGSQHLKAEDKGNQQLMAKIQEQGEYIKNMNTMLEIQGKKSLDFDEKIKNITATFQDQERLLQKNVDLSSNEAEENKKSMRKLQDQSEGIEKNLSKILEFLLEKNKSNLLDNIATNQVELSKKQDDLFRYTFDQGEKQELVVHELNNKFVQSMKEMYEFFDKSFVNVASKYEDNHKHSMNFFSENLRQAAQEILHQVAKCAEVAGTIKGQVQSIMPKIKDHRKRDSFEKSKNASKSICITPISRSVANHCDDSQKELSSYEVNSTPEISNRSSITSKEKKQGQNVNKVTSDVNLSQPSKSFSTNVMSKKKSDKRPKIIAETPVDDLDDLSFTQSQNTATDNTNVSIATYADKFSHPFKSFAANVTSKKKSGKDKTDLKIPTLLSPRSQNPSTENTNANKATYAVNLALPSKPFATNVASKIKSGKDKTNDRDKTDPKIPKMVKIVSNSSSYLQKQVRRSKRLKQSSLVKKKVTIRCPAAITIQVPMPEAAQERISSANKRPAAKIMMKSASSCSVITSSAHRGNVKARVNAEENSEDTFGFDKESLPAPRATGVSKSNKKRPFISIRRPAALLSFFSPSKKPDQSNSTSDPTTNIRKKRRLNLNIKS